MTETTVDLTSLHEMDAKLKSLGPVLDVDSHEMIPIYMYAESFGEEVAAQIAPISAAMAKTFGEDQVGSLEPPSSMAATDSDGAPTQGLASSADREPIRLESIWELKGPTAPGAVDMLRRPELLDVMGIDRQLVFPTFALLGMSLACYDAAPDVFGFEPSSDLDHRAAGRAMIAAQNRWSGEMSRKTDGRARIVAVVMRDTVRQMLEELERCLEDGARAIWIPSTPPAGLSPAHKDLGAFWSACVAADVPVLLHIGTDFGLISSKWHEGVPEFAWDGKSSVEFPIEPYRASNMNLSCENFLGAMIYGGVFERHPKLQMIFPHLGGLAPYLMGRIQWGYERFPACNENLSAPPEVYFQRFYYDTVCRNVPALRMALSMFGVEHVLFGTDIPFREDIDLYTEVRSLLPELLDTLRNMNALTPQIHTDSDFTELFHSVIAKLDE